MNKNSIEFMRKQRERALQDGVRFRKFNIKSDDKKNHAGNIVVAFKLGLTDALGTRFYEAGLAFCSPQQPDPVNFYGQGLAYSRLQSRSLTGGGTILFQVQMGERLVDVLRKEIINYVHYIRRVPWMNGKKVEDLV